MLEGVLTNQLIHVLHAFGFTILNKMIRKSLKKNIQEGTRIDM